MEILERVEKADLDALEYHFRDLVEADEDATAAEKTKVWWSGCAVGGKLP